MQDLESISFGVGMARASAVQFMHAPNSQMAGRPFRRPTDHWAVLTDSRKEEGSTQSRLTVCAVLRSMGEKGGRWGVAPGIRAVACGSVRYDD